MAVTFLTNEDKQELQGNIDKVLYDPVELTEEQKAQARENIDAVGVSDIVHVEKSQSINMFNPDTVTQKTVGSNVYSRSETIPCSVGDVVYVKLLKENNVLGLTGYGLWLVATNGTEVFVAGNRMVEYTVEKHANITTLAGVKIGLYDVPVEDISKIMVTVNTAPTEFEPFGEEIVRGETNLLEKSIKCIPQTLTEEEKAQARENIGVEGATAPFNKVLVLGDSISTDSYGNYTKWVTMLKNEGFLPEATTNNSIHATGFVAKYTGDDPNADNDFLTRIEAVTNKDTYDLVIVFGGINDFIQAVPMGESGGDETTHFKPAVDYFFDYLVNNFTQARLVVLSPLRTYNPYPNAEGFKQEEYTAYIREVAKSYCLPVLNLSEESGFCPFNATFKDRWTFTGWTGGDGTSGDGVHPSEAYMEQFLAPMIKGFLKSLKG